MLVEGFRASTRQLGKREFLQANNMALASKVNGNLSTATEWAKKSRKRGNKKANRYIRVLQNRQLDKKSYPSNFTKN